MIDSLKLNDDFVRPEHGTSIKIELTLDEPLNKVFLTAFLFPLKLNSKLIHNFQNRQNQNHLSFHY